LLREHLQRRVALASGVAGMIGADTEDQHTQQTALDAFMEVREREGEPGGVRHGTHTSHRERQTE
jgi:hypothetical protein